MSDIRNYFKRESSTNKKRTRDQEDDDDKPRVAAKSKPSTEPVQTVPETKRSVEKTKIETPVSTAASARPINPVQKRFRAENYQSFRHRGGPDAPGSKAIPSGQLNCLKNLTFVLSGVLESLERDECKTLIESYGGRVTAAISGKTNYLVLGRDGSEAKENKAKQMKITILTEDELLEMIRTRPGEGASTTKSQSVTPKAKLKPTTSTSEVISKSSDDSNEKLWVDKYKPNSIKNLIGQQGDKSPVQKLIVWLRDWYKHHGRSDEKIKAKPTFAFNRNEDPAMFKAALLSGPPGIGKTTAAQLVCQHLNLEFIEKNASDQRSKKAMATITNDSYSLGQLSKSSSSMSKYVLIMDEVDGVAGNEDRGGVQELILLIKRSRIPIICICNDRQHKKIRSLASYCYDLRFYRPTVQQIRAYMLSILHRENLPEMKTNVLDEIIQSCNQDIRQTIHSLNLWASQGETAGQNAAKMIEKNVNNNPFELCRLSFSNEFRTKSMSEKIQENYISSQPYLSSTENSKRKLTDFEHLNLLSAAADSISLGDICSQMIFGRNDSWSLLPYQAIFSTVAPCSFVRGNLRGAVVFSTFFGQRSRTNKNERLLNELEKHMCLKIASANKQQFNLDYLPYLSNALISPLKQFPTDLAVEKCIKLLDDYYLSRDDLQTLVELNTWAKVGQNSYEKLDAQIKAALTRNYNKTNHRAPYTIIDIKKLKKSKGLIDEEIETDDEEQSDLTVESNSLENDAMIKIAQRLKQPKTTSRKTRAK